VIEFLKERNILVWAGNVHEAEAHKGIWKWAWMCFVCG
jgi:hypothetical protein